MRVQTLHDIYVLLSGMMKITIDEEGERYITSSAIIPRMTTAVNNITTMFNTAGNIAETKFLVPSDVGSWRSTFDLLVARYIEPFFTDKAFLVAKLKEQYQDDH